MAVIEVDYESMIGIYLCYCYYYDALREIHLIPFFFFQVVFDWRYRSCDKVKLILFQRGYVLTLILVNFHNNLFVLNGSFDRAVVWFSY